MEQGVLTGRDLLCSKAEARLLSGSSWLPSTRLLRGPAWWTGLLVCLREGSASLPKCGKVTLEPERHFYGYCM